MSFFSKSINAYKKALTNRPFLTNMCVVSGFMFFGDIAAQKIKNHIDHKKLPINWVRCVEMGIWGCIVGPPLTMWYRILGKFFNVRLYKSHILGKVICDQIVWAPLNILTYLCYCSLVNNPTDFEGMKNKLKNQYVPVMKTNYCVWPFAQLVNFAFIPIQHQVLFVQFCSLLWSVYLCFVGNEEVKKEE